MTGDFRSAFGDVSQTGEILNALPLYITPVSVSSNLYGSSFTPGIVARQASHQTDG